MDNLRKLIEYFPTLNTENLLPWNLVNQEKHFANDNSHELARTVNLTLYGDLRATCNEIHKVLKHHKTVIVSKMKPGELKTFLIAGKI